VVGLYLAPPANAAVFSMDEKPQIQALERSAPVLSMIPGVSQGTSRYRHGLSKAMAPSFGSLTNSSQTET
jgi:hypothetical protein